MSLNSVAELPGLLNPDAFFAEPEQTEDDRRECSKGWSERCGRSKGPRCKCRCGGHNHGNPKADRTRNERLSEDRTCAAFDAFGMIALKKTHTCRWCQHELDLPTYGYPHEGGQSVPGMGKFWLYLVCAGCKYQWSLWKLLR